MSWRQACLQSGYSLSVANKGPRGYSGAEVLKDFERAAEEAAYPPEFIRKAVKHRLMQSVIEGKPSNVAREAELLGKLREVDLFVRNSDIQVGIFGALSTPESSQALDVAVKALDNYRE
jgi:hypothetical protein